FYKPMLVHGLYFCLVQNNVQKGLDILAQYCLLGLQARGIDEITDEFNMTSSCMTFILSTSKTHLGIILDCFGKVKETLGTPQELLLKTPFTKRMPEVYSKLFEE